MNQIQKLQHFFSILFGGTTKAAKGVLNAASSINPFVPQPAIAPESLKPGQKPADKFAPYAVNGKLAGPPGWSLMRSLPVRHPTVPLPQVYNPMQFGQNPGIGSGYKQFYIPPAGDFQIPNLVNTPRGVLIPTRYKPATTRGSRNAY